MANALGADGQLSQKEMAYANAVLNADHSAEIWTSLIRLNSGPDSEELLNQLLDALSPEDAADMAAFLLCLLAVDETISRWQDKLSDKIDYYNRQFTRLEKLVSEMNSQSSTLMGLMGY